MLLKLPNLFSCFIHKSVELLFKRLICLGVSFNNNVPCKCPRITCRKLVSAIVLSKNAYLRAGFFRRRKISLNEWMSESMNDWMNEWLNEWMTEWLNESMNDWMTEWMNDWMTEWLNEWLNDWMNDWLNEWTNEWKNEWLNKWLTEWLNDWMTEWLNDWMNEWMNDWMTEWLNDWMTEWMNEWMNEWMTEWTTWFGTISTCFQVSILSFSVQSLSHHILGETLQLKSIKTSAAWIQHKIHWWPPKQRSGWDVSNISSCCISCWLFWHYPSIMLDHHRYPHALYFQNHSNRMNHSFINSFVLEIFWALYIVLYHDISPCLVPSF